jgi:hypothetical protein
MRWALGRPFRYVGLHSFACLNSSFEPMKRSFLLFWIGKLHMHPVGFEPMTFLSTYSCGRRKKKGVELEDLLNPVGLDHLFFEDCKIVLVQQAITYLTLLKHLHNDPGPHLIVCPASVLENWERELKKWCPSFSILQYHGAARSAYSKELSSLAKAGLPPPFNVLLVCYSLFERHRFV